jgi:hypothetical protein
MRPPSTIALALAILCWACDAAAQSVPLIAVDAEAGSGPSTAVAGETWYLKNRAGQTRIALALRLGSAGRVRPVLIVEQSLDFATGDRVTLCVRAPNGTCLAWFPGVSGPAAALGVRAALSPAFLAGLSAGVGKYSSTVRFVGVDLSARVIPHLSIVAELRHVIWRDAAGHPLWMRPVTLGLRVS